MSLQDKIALIAFALVVATAGFNWGYFTGRFDERIKRRLEGGK